MVAIKKTNTIIPESNRVANDAHIFICRMADARGYGVDWKHYDDTVWKEYKIKETDFRSKTASFTTPQYLDLTTGTYCILITCPGHEEFSGVILSPEYDHSTGLYTYQCQDWSRMYQSKFELITVKKTLHRILQFLITRGGIPIVGAVSKAKLKQYKKMLSGLRPAYQYEQKYYGSTINFNPMTMKNNMVIKGKTFIETIRDLVFGSGAYIDVHFDRYGVIHIEPYTKDDFYKTGLLLTSTELSGLTQKFDTTNIITDVVVESSSKLKAGRVYSSDTLINLNLSAIFGSLTSSISNPNQNTNKTSSSSSGKKVTGKKSNTTNKNNNPYNTKKKIVYISSDNIHNKSTDMNYMKDIAKLLKKQGWKSKIIGLGPGYHSENHMGGCKNGVWFCIYGGIDAAVLRENVIKCSYTNKLKSNKSRAVLGFRPPSSSILKGGKGYKWLPRAWDDNYSPSSFRGISYPLNKLTKNKVPIMYADTAKQMVAKFLKGGDNPQAC